VVKTSTVKPQTEKVDKSISTVQNISMEITYTNQISVADFNHLRKASGFYEIEENQCRTGLENSSFSLCAKHGDKTIGLIRVIGDGGYVVVIADVMVLPEYQGKGIGRAMMEKSMAYINGSLKEGQRVLVNLMAAKDKEPFYRKFGFDVRPDETRGAGMTQWIIK
jgi:GNAT superfamily N-acetyltransferase